MGQLTWIVQKEDFGKIFTLDQLKEFSKKHNAQIIIKGEAITINNGIEKKVH